MKEHFLQKIKETQDEALEVLGQCRLAGHRIVFTNGCFDILHPGHVMYLQEARDLGDFLIVALNDDVSVRRLKGEKRPILPLEERMHMVAALGMVDMVVSFSEDTPLRIIRALNPDILVKGGDYQISEIVGAAEVVEAGGEVKVLSFKENSSTTDIISKIVNRYS